MNNVYRSFLAWLYIFFGIYIILSASGAFYYFRLLGFLFDAVVPLLFLVTGLVYLSSAFKPIEPKLVTPAFVPYEEAKVFLGVSAGLSEYTGTPVATVRILFILFFFLSGGIGLLVYLSLYYSGKNTKKDLQIES